MFYIPLILIIIGTLSYEFIGKTLPQKQNQFLFLISSYLVALLLLFLGLILSNYNFNNLSKDVNIYSVIVGIMVTFIDYGLILVYRNGWKISSFNIVYSTSVLSILTLLGIIFFNESLTLIKCIGIILCFVSIILIEHKKTN